MPHSQSTNAVLMVRPVAFHSNPLTAESNSFQDLNAALSPEAAQEAAVQEFDRLVSTLRSAGITVLVVSDTIEPETPDAVFPNNWITTHSDGTTVTYPMLAENRRVERRKDVLHEILPAAGFEVKNHIDFATSEDQGKFLEGTGSLVLDRQNGIAYACVAPRTDSEVLADFSTSLGYETVVFTAVDRRGNQIYHTNVLMCIGTGYAVICADAIRDTGERQEVLNQLTRTGHELVLIDYHQLESFAGNMLELMNHRGERVLAMSTRAFASLEQSQREQLQEHVSIVHSPINVIEDNAGGSVRCMLAEVFLPQPHEPLSLQEQYLPENLCFGCGPKNEQGLQLRSFVDGDQVSADWMPKPHHVVTPGMLNGGIIGALLDCHCGWTAFWHFYQAAGEQTLPAVATADYAVDFLRPTPSDQPVHLRGWVVSGEGRRVEVHGELSAGGEVRATCRAHFVSVKSDHPLFSS